MRKHDRSGSRISPRVLCASAVSTLLLLAMIVPAVTGCARLKGAQAASAVEGRWRMHSGMILTARLLPDGTLEMIDPRGGRHPFRRVAPDRWEARISRLARGTIRLEGEQLVFRREPTEEARKPIAEQKGLTIARQVRAVEDRMTRVTGTEPTPAAKPPAGNGQPVPTGAPADSAAPAKQEGGKTAAGP
jgi:hypothetical protein